MVLTRFLRQVDMSVHSGAGHVAVAVAVISIIFIVGCAACAVSIMATFVAVAIGG